MRKLLLGVTAAALGALAGILLDPARGRARRARLADQSGAVARQLAQRGDRAWRTLRAQAGGTLQALRARGRETGATDDVTVRDRVESELLGDPSVPKGAINISAERGIVVLRGEVPDEGMRTQLGERAAAVRGVWSVENLLHLPGEPALTHQ
ncbi:MAG TPA: BON domain-containing protein [Candidatus Limnocylindria bacterium]|jgi:osmotically-inducible protein OsmY|nr:BON domain-containing protein [Candidatus Limnocylindria bacterium]